MPEVSETTKSDSNRKRLEELLGDVKAEGREEAEGKHLSAAERQEIFESLDALPDPREEQNFTWKDIVAMTIAVYQLLFPLLGGIILFIVLFFFLFRIIFL